MDENDGMICEEKRRLLEAYRRVTGMYADKVTELHRSMGLSSKAHYDRLYRETEELHADVTKAQGEMNSHVVSHQC
jgi:hypothetical protein